MEWQSHPDTLMSSRRQIHLQLDLVSLACNRQLHADEQVVERLQGTRPGDEKVSAITQLCVLPSPALPYEGFSRHEPIIPRGERDQMDGVRRRRKRLPNRDSLVNHGHGRGAQAERTRFRPTRRKGFDD